MKCKKLSEIVEAKAKSLKNCASYNGSVDNEGFFLLARLREFRNKLVFKHDLRPSEYSQVDEIEVFEPIEFSDIIREYKIKIALEGKIL